MTARNFSENAQSRREFTEPLRNARANNHAVGSLKVDRGAKQLSLVAQLTQNDTKVTAKKNTTLPIVFADFSVCFNATNPALCKALFYLESMSFDGAQHGIFLHIELG